MTLPLKYRPKKFEMVIGNTKQVAALGSVLDRGADDIPHAYFISGDSGCGKTTIARIIARMLGCKREDFHEWDSIHIGNVEATRDLRTKMLYKPRVGDITVYFMDECHGLSTKAQDNLLKATEEAPAHVFFIFATSEPEKLKPTFKRRCHMVTLNTVPEEAIDEHMVRIIKREGKKVPQPVRDAILMECCGSPGIALALLDAVIDMPADEMEAVVAEQAEAQSTMVQLAKLMMAKKPNWKKVKDILKALGDDPESTRRRLLAYGTSCMLGGNEGAYLLLDAFRDNFYDTGRAGLVLACYEACNPGA